MHSNIFPLSQLKIDPDSLFTVSTCIFILEMFVAKRCDVRHSVLFLSFSGARHFTLGSLPSEGADKLLVQPDKIVMDF